MSGDPARGALRLPAPAKINLFLHVIGRREDGYHELETLFLFLDHGDNLSLELRDDGVVTRRHGPAALRPDEDLSVRAARALKAHCAVSAGVSIGLSKRLPMGGGLGGGSSDAATVLVGLNRLWDCQLDEEALAALALGLGADVPVFVRGRAAFATGIGERLSPQRLPKRWFLVLCPPVQVASARVFADPSLTRNAKPLKIHSFPWSTNPDVAFDAVWRQSRNDCEPVVCAAEPQVRRVRDWLREHAPTRMTGTGACVFAVLPGEQAARDLARRALCDLAPADGATTRATDPERPAWPGLSAFVAAGVSCSPLRRAMSERTGAGQ